nr:protein BASIC PENTACYSTEINE2-like [Ipomoea batatas]
MQWTRSWLDNTVGISRDFSSPVCGLLHEIWAARNKAVWENLLPTLEAAALNTHPQQATDWICWVDAGFLDHQSAAAFGFLLQDKYGAFKCEANGPLRCPQDPLLAEAIEMSASKKNDNSPAQRAKRAKKSIGVVISGVDTDISSIPTPVYTCTRTPQQCYRWGCGGWQSACCTTTISMYPLPMSKRRGARIAGRKMSQGAFKKVLEKLAGEGYNFANPIDLRTHWAKHGTNKFVTISKLVFGLSVVPFPSLACIYVGVLFCFRAAY